MPVMIKILQCTTNAMKKTKVTEFFACVRIVNTQGRLEYDVLVQMTKASYGAPMVYNFLNET